MDDPKLCWNEFKFSGNRQCQAVVAFSAKVWSPFRTDINEYSALFPKISRNQLPSCIEAPCFLNASVKGVKLLIPELDVSERAQSVNFTVYMNLLHHSFVDAGVFPGYPVSPVGNVSLYGDGLVYWPESVSGPVTYDAAALF